MISRKVFVALALSVLVAMSTSFSCADGRYGKLIETWQTTNGSITVRVSAFLQRGVFLEPGAYYVFQASPAPSKGWQEIMTFRHDDPVPIPRTQVRFVNEQIAYVFMGWMHAVTTDGGQTWSTWTATRDLPGWQCCNYNLIRDVIINKGGYGRM